MTLGRWTAGGFGRIGSPWAPGEEERAASLAFQAGGTRFWAEGVRRSGAGAGELWTLGGRVALLPLLRLGAEYGAGSGDRGVGAARLLTLEGAGRGLSYTLHHLRVAGGFPWRGGFTREELGTLALRPWARLHLDVLAGRREGGGWPRGVPYAAPEPGGWLVNAGVGYGGGPAMRVERRGEPSGGVTESVRVQWGLALGPLRLVPELQRGTAAPFPGAAAEPFRRAALRSTLAAFGGSLSASLERTGGVVPGNPAARGGTVAALDAAAPLGEATRVRAALRAVRYGGTGFGDETFFDAAVDRTLPRGQRVSAGVRLTRGAPGIPPERTLRLGYTLPLGVPVAPVRGGGRVAGRVYDAATGAPLAGARVSVGGRTSLTDGRGRLAFAGLPVGTHTLRVEAAGEAAAWVPARETRVEVGPGIPEARVEVAMVRAARIRGVVRVVDAADSAGVAGAVVEIARDGEVHRRVTGADGGFDFAELRPGRWTLVVAGAPLPAHHRFERDTVVAELAPGESREVVLRALPVRRTVRMLTQGEVVVEAPRDTVARPATPSAPPAATPPGTRLPRGGAGSRPPRSAPGRSRGATP